MPFIEARDGTSLFYKDWGSGPPAVFVSSWALPSDMWQYQMTAMVDAGVRCIAPDTRGLGRSDQPGTRYDYDTLAADLAALLDHLDLRDVTLIGHSMGGGVVVRYLARYGSERVGRVALLAPTTPFLLKTADNPDGIDRVAVEYVRAAFSKDFPKWLDDNAAPFFSPETSPQMIDWVAGLMRGTSLKVAIDLNRISTESDFRAELPEIRVPVLIIHGDADVSAPINLTGRRTAELIPGSTFTMYEGAPHGLMFTHTDRLNSDLLAFVTSGVLAAAVAG